MGVVIVMVADRLGQGAALGFIDAAQGATRIHDLFHARVYFLVQIVLKVQEVNINGISYVIRSRLVPIR